MLETDDRVILSSAGCYSRSDGSWTRRSGNTPAIWFLEAVCARQQGGVSKSQASADLSLRFLRLIEDARRISPVQVIGSTDQNSINSSPCTKPASVKHCDLRPMLITGDEHGFSNHQSSCAHQAPAVVLPWTQLPWNPVRAISGGQTR